MAIAKVNTRYRKSSGFLRPDQELAKIKKLERNQNFKPFQFELAERKRRKAAGLKDWLKGYSMKTE